MPPGRGRAPRGNCRLFDTGRRNVARDGLSAGGDWIRTSSTRAREVGCRAPTAAKLNGSTKPLSMRLGDLRSARTPHQGTRARTSLCSTVGPRTAPRAPFHHSRDRARYRYYEGSRCNPRVGITSNCSFSRDVMRQSSRASHTLPPYENVKLRQSGGQVSEAIDVDYDRQEKGHSARPGAADRLRRPAHDRRYVTVARGARPQKGGGCGGMGDDEDPCHRGRR